MKITLDGDQHTLLGRVGDGEFCDVFYARRDNPSEMLALKVCRAEDTGAPILRREAANLRAMASMKVRGSDYFSSFLPQNITTVRVKDGSLSRVANRYLWRTGFDYTFEDIFREYHRGVDPRDAIWMWKRMLALLGWVHECGWVHGSVTPQHLLVHPRDHGVVFSGWSRVVATGERLPARSPGYELYYPSNVWEGGSVSYHTDIVMSARCICKVLGPDASNLPEALVRLVDECMWGKMDTPAWKLMEEVDRVAKKVYRGNHFHEFEMPRKM